MKELRVELGEKSYPIYIGSNLLGHPALLQKHIKSKQVFIVTNTTVAPLYLQRVIDSLSECQIETITLPDGEQYKSLEYLTKIFDQLLEKKYSRNACLLALGGGVIGDMGGFAAA
ncbi:MAG TPA: iron-containing alcohol dehydrogenase, partial [Methylococcaceae bacterium]|nr:iron-containing alcohol dehydrogenase [Methylococcaceae bacterium]